MPAQAQSQITTPRLRNSLFAATVVGLLIMTIRFFHSEPEPALPLQAPAQAAGTVLGPGTWINSSSTSDDYNGLMPPGGLAVDEKEELVINLALLDVFNFFLLEQSSEDRANVLKRYLKSKLPVPALAEALQIAQQYQIYMKSHDEFLAAQNLSAQNISLATLDIHRLTAWREQRNRLQQNILGDKVALAWYQNDEAQLTQVLEEVPQYNGTEGADTPLSHPAPHFLKRSDELRHNQYMQNVIEKFTKSYSNVARDALQWALRYTAYREAALQINLDTTINTDEKSHRIRELLVTFFPTEEQRQQARERADFPPP